MMLRDAAVVSKGIVGPGPSCGGPTGEPTYVQTPIIGPASSGPSMERGSGE